MSGCERGVLGERSQGVEMRVAAIQMTSTPDRARNMTEAHGLLLEALEKNCDLVAFPEMFALLSDRREDYLRDAETLRGVTVATLQEWAAEYDIWVLGGSLPLKVAGDPKHVTNTSLLIAPDGEIRARYDKIHLFDASIAQDRSYQESKLFKPGKKVVTAEIQDFGSVGLSVCYDLRFPELYRKMAQKGVNAIFIPSAFTPITGKAHWDVLTRARAIENQAYVVAPAQVGQNHEGRSTYGHTRIVDPWGRVIAERPAGPGVVWADLNLEELARIRRDLPALANRRL